MNSSFDSFALSFDSIKLDGKSPLTGAASDAARIAPAEGPGFYLLDDAGGRFVIDHETGIVTLVHDHVLELEAGTVHAVRLKVIEPSGATYAFALKLRITGRVPQVLGSEADAAIAALTAAPLSDLMAPPLPSIPAPAQPAPLPALLWTQFAAATKTAGALQGLGSERAAFGALIAAPAATKAASGGADLRLAHATPAPSSAAAHWLI